MPTYTVTVPMHLMDRFKGRWAKFRDDITRQIYMEARNEIPTLIQSMLGIYSTGKLAESTRISFGQDLVKVSIGSGVPHAGYVFRGKRRTIIDQRAMGRSWPMIWSHVGGSGIAWSVDQPAIAARTDILDAVRERILDIAERVIAVSILGLSRGGA